jgi:very-short-patch-repair endonuclease
MRARPPLTPHRSAVLSERAHGMRHNMTRSEAALWSRLRRKQLGVSFRRQVPLGGRFIADFFASARRLVVEVDGPWHRGRDAADARRDRVLARLGYRVLRLDEALVLGDLAQAVERVREALALGR